MSVMLITYDLNNEKNRPPIVNKIEKLGDVKRLSESSYAVDTQLSTQAIFNSLKPLIDQDDFLYVITLKEPDVGWGPSHVVQWLDRKLTY